MKRRLIISLATLALTLAMSTSAFASALVVSIDGDTRVFTESVETAKDTLVYAEEFADKINVSYSYNVSEEVLTFMNESNTLILFLNKDKGILNDKEVSLITAPIMGEKGEVLVPLNFMSETFGVEVSKVEESADNDFSTSHFSDLNGLGEITENTTVYTYNDALELLNENSVASQRGELGKEQIQESIDGLNGALSAMAGVYQNTNIFDPVSYNKIVLAQGELNESQKDLEKQIKLIELSNELQLMSQLNALTKAKTDLYLAEKNLELEKRDLEITKVKNQLGMVSNYSVKKAEDNLAKSEKSLKTLEDAVKVEKQDLNALLRLPLDEDIFVEFHLDVEEKEYDLDKLVTVAIDKSLNVEEKEKALDDVKIGSSDDSIAVKTARLDLEQAEEAVEKNVYSTYNNLNTLVANYEMLLDSREALVRDYELAEIQYELGYITKHDLNKIAVGVATMDASIISLEMTYQMLCFQLDHPQLF